MQRLLLPFKRSTIICGYKTARYRAAWGYPHYGIDISTYQGVMQADHKVRASGNGRVVWCDFDRPSGNAKSLGWALAVRYDDCIGRDGSVRTIVVRYMHCPAVYVSVGRYVKAGDVLADEGMVGTSSMHLHLEMDTDTDYPQYTPQVSTGHSGWKKGVDNAKKPMLNPSLWLWQSDDAKLEKYNFSDKTWITAGIDDNLPFVPKEPDKPIGFDAWLKCYEYFKAVSK